MRFNIKIFNYSIVFISIIISLLRLFQISKENKNFKYDFNLELYKGDKGLVGIIIVFLGLIFVMFLKDSRGVGVSIPILLAYVVNMKKNMGLNKEGIVHYKKLIKWDEIQDYEFKNKCVLIVNNKFYFQFKKQYYKHISNFIKLHLSIKN